MTTPNAPTAGAAPPADDIHTPAEMELDGATYVRVLQQGWRGWYRVDGTDRVPAHGNEHWMLDRIYSLRAALAAARREVEALREYVRASEYWQLAPHDQKERHAYFAKHPAFIAALAAPPEEK